MHITPIVRVAALVCGALACAASLGCERRIIRKEERPFMDYAEQNWRKLTPTQKADYYEMVEKQRDRARRERERESRRGGAQ
ncbi:MAG: hypothetical protein IT574_00930 [Candidatus Aureabacteria bacterium]|nr:hypothetical protein [Candidatus Auribacterota bacterium]NLW93436.1 hypothetical protein [Chlamydiota bacterium]HQM52270.1 hypothetical protein [bacterium]